MGIHIMQIDKMFMDQTLEMHFASENRSHRAFTLICVKLNNNKKSSS